MDWTSLDWTALERLRARFLEAPFSQGDYWKTTQDVAAYDLTFAERIRWKWEAVLQELKLRGWTPPKGAVLDWGCGSGVASRAFLTFYGAEGFNHLHLWDHSPLASEYAADKAIETFPDLEIMRADLSTSTPPPEVKVLLLSHVLNELTPEALTNLRGLLQSAESIIWIEPGTREISRKLLEIREGLQTDFHLVAPCTHQAACALLLETNHRHWCHHFAQPPSSIFSDANWGRFSRKLGIDLRSVPYSFLVLQKKLPARGDAACGVSTTAGELSRIIAAPRQYKGYCKILSCQQSGVEELMLQKRDDPELFKIFKKDRQDPVYRWQRQKNRIVGTLPP